MNAYVAGSTREIHLVQNIQHLVTNAGHTIHFDWTREPDKNIRHSWEGHELDGAWHSHREVQAAKCELFILVTPQTGGVGCFIELGVALGHGALCYVFPFVNRDSVFFYHPNVYVIRSKKQLVYALRVAQSRFNQLHDKWVMFDKGERDAAT